MDEKQKSTLTWAGTILLLSIAIYKFRDSLGLGTSFNPNSAGDLSSVWNDTPSKHAAYTYRMHASSGKDLAIYIYNQLGSFSDNFTNIMTAFKQCQTKGDVYQICVLFRNTYDVGLWQSLINGYGLFPWSGLSNNELEEINNFVNSLPS
jgi:hypothetical protein